MPARRLLPEHFACAGDLEALRHGFARLATGDRFRHKARKIVAVPAGDNCFHRQRARLKQTSRVRLSKQEIAVT